MTERSDNLIQSLNKDSILREYLALERTRMANERTLLSFVRTGLYFIVAGSTLGQVTDTAFWKYLGVPSIVVGLIIVITGAVLYARARRHLKESRNQIGNIQQGFIDGIL